MATEVNVPLLRKAVEWAEAEAAKPSELCEWRQAYYVVPTPAELAQLGESFDPMDSLSNNAAWVAGARQELADDCGTCFCIAGFVAYQAEGNMRYREAEPIALRHLGLTVSQGDALFAAYNSIEDVRRIAEEIAGERL